MPIQKKPIWWIQAVPVTPCHQNVGFFFEALDINASGKIFVANEASVEIHGRDNGN